MTHARVAVIIPAFNEAATIERSVRAVVAEPWDDRVALHSVVVVDDRSSDATGTKAARLAAELPMVHVLHHSVRSGKNAGIRTGLGHVRDLGVDIVVVLDADVRLRAGAVVLPAHLLLDRPELGGTSCVNVPLPPRSWRERPSHFQARMLAEVARTGDGPLQRLFALRLAGLEGLELPDSTHDDVYISRWLQRSGQGTASVPGAAIEVRAATGLHDFAKQTLRSRHAMRALDVVLPPAPTTGSSARGLRLRDVVRSAREDPIGATMYAGWFTLALVTPRRWWLPEVDHTRYDQSASTKILD